MQSNKSINHLNFNYKDILIDEIALEGLDGIGFKLLWARLAHRLATDITQKMEGRFWTLIVHSPCIEVYNLSEPAIVFKIEDRFKYIHEESGNIQATDFYFDGPFELKLIPEEFGCSSNYYKRVHMAKSEISKKTYGEILEIYGDTLVFVASPEERWHALASHAPYKLIDQLTPTGLAVLELIGRARENGQVTVGRTNLAKISNDPKIIFYYKNRLEGMGLITSTTIVQFIDTKNFKSLLFRLKRFYKPKILTGPKEGIMCDLMTHLISLPEHKDSRQNLIHKNIITQTVWKKLLKKLYSFKFESDSTNKRGVPNRTHIILGSDTEDSNDSQSDEDERNLPRKQKIGINMYTQAYEVLLEAGLKGLTQIELGHVLGVNFYVSRSICRIFKNQKLVRMLTVDQGKQKTRKFIANGASGDSIKVYVDEKEKLLGYLAENSVKYDQNVETKAEKRKAIINEDEQNEEVPIKKIKVERTDETIIDDTEIGDNIVEFSMTKNAPNLSMSKTLLLPTTGLTLRQLKVANAIIKTVREHKVVETLRGLNSFICKEVGPPPLDTKCLKQFLTKLAADGQLRVYNIKWPWFNERNTLIVCLPNMTKNHPSILAVYSKISSYAKKQKIIQNEKQLRIIPRKKLFTYTYSRYLKMKKMHEFLYNLIYLNPDGVELFNSDTSLPKGFASLGHVIQEMSLELVVGHLSVKRLYQLNIMNHEDTKPNVKLKDAPSEIRQNMLYSNNFTLSLKSSIEMLANLGLLQTCFRTELIQSCLEDKKKQLFYLNRNAKVIDTRGKWPRDSVGGTSNKVFTFSFDGIEVVNKYWDIVQDICLQTKRTLPIPKSSETLKPPVRSIEEVLSHDKGELMGDGLGPGGFHSGYRTEMSQLWKQFSILPCKKVSILLKPKQNTRQLKKPPRPLRKKPKKEPKKRISKLRKILALTENNQRSNKNITWTSIEDEILLWTKVAMIVLSHSGVAGFLHITYLAAKDLLLLRGTHRTVLQCIRRGKILDNKHKFIHQKQLLISELRRNDAVIQNYQGLIKTLRTLYANDLKQYVQESRLKLMELVWIIQQLSKFLEYSNVVPAIALNFSDFHKAYSIVISNTSKSLFRTPDDCPIEVGTIKEGIMLVLSLGYLNTFTTTTSTQIFDTFNKYEERYLRTATDQLHKSSAVAIKDKYMNNQLQKTTYNDIVQYAAGFKLSSFYQRRWLNRMNSSFVGNMTNLLESYKPTNHIKGNSEICCFLLELNALNALKIITTQNPSIPKHLIIEEVYPQVDLEIRNNFKSGTVGWVNTSNVTFMKDLYKSIDYCSSIIVLIRNATVKNVGKNISINDDDELLLALKQAASRGQTFQQLQDITHYSTENLKLTLKKFEEKHIVKRVGYYENYIVLSTFLEPWCIKFGDTNIIPSPWCRLGLQITYPIFIKWCGTILNKIFEAPGCSMSTIAEALDYITPRSVQDVCMVLQKCKCIIIKTLMIKKVDLFSDDDDEDAIQLVEFNEYAAFDSLVVFPVSDSIVKFASLRNNIKQYCLDIERD